VVCLTEETTETLYRIGAGDLVVGVSGFTVRPAEARRKPKVSAFLTADADAIAALHPDLVVGFSDLQAAIARDLVKRGLAVLVTNQRSVAEILQTIRVVSAAVGRAEAGEALADELSAGLERIAAGARALPRRPRVFFEEWPDPLISAIRWVSELVELAGGEDVCADCRGAHEARGRIYDPREVARRDPEVVIASWCGKRARRDLIAARPGFGDTAAVRRDQIYEVASSVILQPEPAALTDGVSQIADIVAAAAGGRHLPSKRLGSPRSA